MQNPSTSLSLLNALREDDQREEAWAIFQERYRDVILGWSRRRGLQLDQAEDVTQEILIKLFEQLQQQTYDPQRGRFRSWLKAVVNNALTDFWRQYQRDPTPGGVGGTDYQMHLANLQAPEVVEELRDEIENRAQSIEMEALKRVRAKVKETTWQAFYQTLVEGRPAAEVAEALNISLGTVYKASQRVKKHLREEYRHVRVENRAEADLSESTDAAQIP